MTKTKNQNNQNKNNYRNYKRQNSSTKFTTTSTQQTKTKASLTSQMQQGDTRLCQSCTYCWKEMGICSAMGTFQGYGCKMYENEVTHMKYPEYMKTNRYPTNNQKRTGQK